MAQGDLDTAVALYFSMNESGPIDVSSTFHEGSAPAHSAPPATRQQPVGINIDSDPDDYMEIDREPAQLSGYAVDLDRVIAERDGQRQQAAHLQQKHRLFNKAPSRGPSIDSFANFSEPERGGGLSKMFGMPVFCINANPEISTFLHAKQSAASMFRRLIVNVLDQSMVSLDQNRDLWGHDDVAALVVEHYCLFQLHQQNDAAAEYLQLYPLRQGFESHKFPIIDILDPLTGMLIQRLSGAVAARQLCGILRQHAKEEIGGEVIFSHSSYASPPSAASQSSHASASMASESDSPSVWSSLGDGGDDDVRRAIAASLGDPDASAPLRPRSPVRAVSSAQKVRDETDLAYKESLMRDRLADEERERARQAEENRVVLEKKRALEEAQRAAQAEHARSLRKSELQAKFAQEPTSSDSVSLAFRCCRHA
jgi:hypothetical protein